MADHTVAADAEEPPVLLDRPARATRGKRITKLVEEEVEQDEAFWGQEALKEIRRFQRNNSFIVFWNRFAFLNYYFVSCFSFPQEEEDDNYEEEQDAGDEFDSDFGEDESEPDDDPEKEVRESLPIKKRLIFPGKTMKKMKAKKKKKKKKKKKVIKLEDEGKTDKTSNKPTSSKQSDVPDEWESEKTIRKSTRTSVMVRQAEREAIRAEKEATMKPIKKKKEEKRMTQEEMLLEAAETEIMNSRNLERVLAREEVKKKGVVQKAGYEGPMVRSCSRDGESHLEFINGALFGSELCTTSTPYPEKSVCVVTGLPAKYLDPKTRLPYATREAFRIIRESFLKEEPDKKRPNMSNMGELFESITGEYYTPKKRRIEARSPISEDLRNGRRFRRIPALDMLDED